MIQSSFWQSLYSDAMQHIVQQFWAFWRALFCSLAMRILSVPSRFSAKVQLDTILLGVACSPFYFTMIDALQHINACTVQCATYIPCEYSALMLCGILVKSIGCE